MAVKEIVTGVLFLVSIALGMALSGRGRPLDAALSVVHKLVSLSAVVVLAFLVFGQPGLLVSGTLPAALGIGSLIFAVALIATGAILSGAAPHAALKTVHGIATALAVICLAGAMIL